MKNATVFDFFGIFIDFDIFVSVVSWGESMYSRNG